MIAGMRLRYVLSKHPRKVAKTQIRNLKLRNTVKDERKCLEIGVDKL